LGERFAPLTRNGQTVDMWNADCGTCSDKGYKDVPFFMTSRGWGVLVNDPGRVSFEIGTEQVTRAQFAVPGEDLDYYLILGPTPKDVLTRLVVWVVAYDVVYDGLRRSDGDEFCGRHEGT
jgi:alpha-D-xyloside xylohydrolase